jgi:hypothetical protein
MPNNTRRRLLRASGAAALLAVLGAGRASAQALDVVKIVTGFPRAARRTRSAGGSPRG